MEGLKPCPFCGGEAVMLEIPPHIHIIVDLPDCSGSAFVECTKCTAAISGETVEEAIEIWNRRQVVATRLEEKYADEAKQRARNEAKCIVKELTEVASWFMVDKVWFLDEVLKEIEKMRKGSGNGK